MSHHHESGSTTQGGGADPKHSTSSQLAGTMDHIYLKFKEQQAAGSGNTLLDRHSLGQQSHVH